MISPKYLTKSNGGSEKKVKSNKPNLKHMNREERIDYFEENGYGRKAKIDKCDRIRCLYYRNNLNDLDCFDDPHWLVRFIGYILHPSSVRMKFDHDETVRSLYATIHTSDGKTIDAKVLGCDIVNANGRYYPSDVMKKAVEEFNKKGPNFGTLSISKRLTEDEVSGQVGELLNEFKRNVMADIMSSKISMRGISNGI